MDIHSSGALERGPGFFLGFLSVETFDTLP